MRDRAKEVIENCYFYPRCFPRGERGIEKLQSRQRERNRKDRREPTTLTRRFVERSAAMAKFCESAFLSIVNPFRTSRHRPHRAPASGVKIFRRNQLYENLASESVARTGRTVVARVYYSDSSSVAPSAIPTVFFSPPSDSFAAENWPMRKIKVGQKLDCNVHIRRVGEEKERMKRGEREG